MVASFRRDIFDGDIINRARLSDANGHVYQYIGGKLRLYHFNFYYFGHLRANQCMADYRGFRKARPRDCQYGASGAGYAIAFLVVLGGLAFNIGNIGGAGLGLQVLFGIKPEIGALISAAVAVLIFVIKEAGKVMDRFMQIAGIVMIVLTVYVAVTTAPPVGHAVVKTFMPDHISVLAIVTLVGGTVGGYITFAGGHRLLDSGIQGKEVIPQVTKSSVTGVLITSVMRIALFLAVLGVVSKGLRIDPDNPAASVFRLAAGNVGYKIFGVIMWSAAITSVIGAAYTSVSFFKSFSAKIEKHSHGVIIGFIIVSTLIFVTIGQPAKILVAVGSLNGLILPLALAMILLGAYKKKIVGDYKHPIWLTIAGRS